MIRFLSDLLNCWRGFRPRYDRGRDDALVCAAPPSEPYVRISRIRLSGWQFTSLRGRAPRCRVIQDRPPASAFRWFTQVSAWNAGAGTCASDVLARMGNRYRMFSLPQSAATSASLPPFAPQALPRFPAPTTALTPAGRAPRANLATVTSRPAPAGLPSSRVLSFPNILSPTTPTGTLRASVFAPGGCGACAPQTSPFASRLAAAAVAESCSLVIMVCLVVIRCSPPRLAATQLLRLLTGTTATSGQGLSLWKSAPLYGALEQASCLFWAQAGSLCYLLNIGASTPSYN